ncbi:MAG: type 4a pilus biogenesis protein PilO [Candidatus Omnitrophica bacterium]|nr:type 4a pilus biogenesis protein PilO [Candidatus Omnitrophota bacterium]
MAMIRLSRNLQIAAFIAGLALTWHFYNILVYKPMLKKVKVLAQEKMQLAEELKLINVGEDELQSSRDMYQKQFDELSGLEKTIEELEQALPSRQNMAPLLGQLTSELANVRAEFISIEPTFKKMDEEGNVYDSIEIKVQFYADYAQVIEYLKKIESSNILVAVKKLEMVLDPEVSKKPLVTVEFVTMVSERSEMKAEKEVKPVIEMPVPTSPFYPDTKPYDNRLPGNHRLSMVVWRGGTPVALIDGKLIKEGDVIDNKTLSKIDSKGAWFTEDGVKYYLGIEK